MGLTEKEAPFTEPYALAGNKKGYRSKGNTALAVKRALAHLGFLKWEPDKWDNQWNEKVNDAATAWKRKREIGTDGSWGKKAHDTMRTAWYEKDGDQLPAFDGESQRLLKEEQAAQQPSSSDEERVREAITDFCERAINEPWNYTQNRAIDVSVDPDANDVDSDCSGSTIQAFHYAKRETGLDVQDPSQQGWSGYGNTNYYEDDWPTVSSPFKVGDLAHYDGHVCVCYHAGDATTSRWFSFGSEPPSSRTLYYRDDFRKVVRPRLLA
jgi:hypothetical protein